MRSTTLRIIIIINIPIPRLINARASHAEQIIKHGYFREFSHSRIPPRQIPERHESIVEPIGEMNHDRGIKEAEESRRK